MTYSLRLGFFVFGQISSQNCMSSGKLSNELQILSKISNLLQIVKCLLEIIYLWIGDDNHIWFVQNGFTLKNAGRGQMQQLENIAEYPLNSQMLSQEVAFSNHALKKTWLSTNYCWQQQQQQHIHLKAIHFGLSAFVVCLTNCWPFDPHCVKWSSKNCEQTNHKTIFNGNYI